jgi:hypothetical protein
MVAMTDDKIVTMLVEDALAKYIVYPVEHLQMMLFLSTAIMF